MTPEHHGRQVGNFSVEWPSLCPVATEYRGGMSKTPHIAFARSPRPCKSTIRQLTRSALELRVILSIIAINLMSGKIRSMMDSAMAHHIGSLSSALPSASNRARIFTRCSRLSRMAAMV